MSYSIGQVSELLGIPASTLRFYDKKGLLPMVLRDKNGIRFFTEKDLKGLKTIEYLKKAGMSIKDIKKFVDWCNCGDETLHDRYDLFLNRKKIVEQQIEELHETLNIINKKCSYYEEAVKNGKEDKSKCPFYIGKVKNRD